MQWIVTNGSWSSGYTIGIVSDNRMRIDAGKWNTKILYKVKVFSRVRVFTELESFEKLESFTELESLIKLESFTELESLFQTTNGEDAAAASDEDGM